MLTVAIMAASDISFSLLWKYDALWKYSCSSKVIVYWWWIQSNPTNPAKRTTGCFLLFSFCLLKICSHSYMGHFVKVKLTFQHCKRGIPTRKKVRYNRLCNYLHKRKCWLESRRKICFHNHIVEKKFQG